MFIECDLGVVVDGTDERQLFHGSGATTVLPELLPLLDGQNTMSEIAERLPSYPRSAVTDAVTLLDQRAARGRGGRRRPRLVRVASTTRAILPSPYRCHARASRSRWGPAPTASFRVLMIGDAPNCAVVADQLAQCGPRLVTIASDPEGSIERQPIWW